MGFHNFAKLLLKYPYYQIGSMNSGENMDDFGLQRLEDRYVRFYQAIERSAITRRIVARTAWNQRRVGRSIGQRADEPI